LNDGDYLHGELRRIRRRNAIPRSLLALGGAAQSVIALPWLFGSSPWWSGHSASTAHLTRDGALGIAFGFLALLVAARVSRAWFAMPIALLLTVVQAIFVVVDTGVVETETTGVPIGFELVHLLGLSLAAGIVALTRPPSTSANGPLRVFDR
jgi:hypothetical protein